MRANPRAISLALSAASGTKPRSVYNTTDILTFLGQFTAQELSDRQLSNVTVDIPVPTYPVPDPYYAYPHGLAVASPGNLTMPFRRTAFTLDAAGTPQQQNTQTAYVDGSVIYGTSQATASALRAGSGGRLRSDTGSMLPLNQAATDPSQPLLPGVITRNFVPLTQLRASGNLHVNENPAVLVLGTLFMREHNRRAALVGANASHMGDEELFQYARKWTVAQLQHIVFSEYLQNTGIVLQPYPGYNPAANAGIDHFFATAAFRYGHAAVSDTVLRLDADGQESAGGHLMLYDTYFRPDRVLEDGIEPLLRGAVVKPQGAITPSFAASVQHHLFGMASVNGTDLIAVNIQRGRDHGLPDYNTIRTAYGLPPAKTWADITPDPALQAALSTVYLNDLSNVDGYVGGLAESHADPSHMGPLFTASMTDQFERLRDGDWWYFENTANGLFTPAEVQQIKSIGLRDIILANTDIQQLPTNIYRLESVGQSYTAVMSSAAQSYAALTSPGAPSYGALLAVGGNTSLGDPGLASTVNGQLVGPPPPPDPSSVIVLLNGNYNLTLLPTSYNGQDYVSVSIVARTTGWVGFGVAAGPTTRMRGADLIIARTVNGTPQVEDYMSDDFGVPQLDTAAGGRNNAVLLSMAVAAGVTTVEFLRPIVASDARDLPVSDNELTLLFAYSPTNDNNLTYHTPSARGYLTVFDLGRDAAAAAAFARATTVRRQHGILMSISFMLILPAGALAARHLRSHWVESYGVLVAMFYGHMVCQIVGAVLATAGFIIAVNEFMMSYTDVLCGHGSIGIAVMVLLYTQLLMGLIRPPGDVSSRKRRYWELGHAALGRFTITLGIINVAIGVHLFTTEYSDDFSTWVALCGVSLASVGLTQSVLDRYEKHQVDKLDRRDRLMTERAAAAADDSDDDRGSRATDELLACCVPRTKSFEHGMYGGGVVGTPGNGLHAEELSFDLNSGGGLGGGGLSSPHYSDDPRMPLAAGQMPSDAGRSVIMYGHQRGQGQA